MLLQRAGLAVATVLLGLGLGSGLLSRPARADEGTPFFDVTPPDLTIVPGATAVWPVSGGSAENTSCTGLTMPASASVLWDVHLEGQGLFRGSPAVDSRHFIYACVNGSSSGKNGILYCCSNGGRLAWQIPLDAPVDVQPVVLQSGNILVYDELEHLHAFNAQDGTALWEHDFTKKKFTFVLVQPQPDPAGGCLLFDDSPALYSVADDGSIRWSTEFHDPLMALSLRGDAVYTSDSGGFLNSYGRQSGQLISSRQVKYQAYHNLSSPAGSSFVYGACAGGELGYAMMGFNFAGPDISYPTGTKMVETPVTCSPAGALVFSVAWLTPDKGVVEDIVSLGLDGSQMWSVKAPGDPWAPFLCDKSGRLYFGTSATWEPGVYCLDPADGHQIWHLPVTNGATSVFPVEEGHLGVYQFNSDQVSSELLLVGANPPLKLRNMLVPSDGRQ